MAYIITDNNYITALCSKCGQEVKVDISAGLSNGIKNWYSYHCQHCGHIDSIEENMISSEHRAYSIDELKEKLQQQPYQVFTTKEGTQIIDLNSLKRIADSLDEIKDLLKKWLENNKYKRED